MYGTCSVHTAAAVRSESLLQGHPSSDALLQQMLLHLSDAHFFAVEHTRSEGSLYRCFPEDYRCMNVCVRSTAQCVVLSINNHIDCVWAAVVLLTL